MNLKFITPFFLLWSFSSLALSQSAASIDMGPLNPYLSAGTQGAWNIQPRNGSVIFQNFSGSGDITYYYVNTDPADEGSRDISVDVSLLDFGEYSFAGLLYGYTDNPVKYYIFALQGNDTVSLFQRSEAGFELRSSQQYNSRSLDSAHLSIRERGNSVTFYVNQEEIGSLSNDLVGKGAVGIAASDIGTYQLNKFRVSTNTTSSASLNNEENLIAALRPQNTQKALAKDTQATDEDENLIAALRPQNTQKTFTQDIPVIDKDEKLIAALIPRNTQKALPKGTQIIDEFDAELGMVTMRMVIPASWVVQPKKQQPNGESYYVAYESADGYFQVTD